MKFSFLLVLVLSIPGWIQTAEAKWSTTTFNIRNFDKDPWAGKTDLQELGKILNTIKSDVMGFQEIVNKTAFDSLVKKNLPGYAYETSKCGGGGKQHLAVAYDTKTFELVNQAEDMTFSGTRDGSCGSLRPVFLVTLKHKASKTNYTFGVVHLKAGGNNRAYSQRWDQYLKLTDLSEKYAKENLILLGDFNSTGYILKDEDFSKFESFTTDSSMKTMSAAVGCTNYWKGIQGGYDFQPSILDHIVIQEKNSSSVESVKVASHCAKMDCRPATPEELGLSYKSVSDHCPVQVTFR